MVLYVIGNGFDLKHGLKTRYCDFYTYLKTNDVEEFEIINDLWGNPIDNNYLWADFENNFANINPAIFDMLCHLYPDLSLFENVFKKDIINSLKKWIKHIEKEEVQATFFDFNEDDVFLDFNYTSTLTNKYNVDINNDFKIHGNIYLTYYGDELFSLIFGHGVNSPNCLNQVKQKREYTRFFQSTTKEATKIINEDKSRFFSNLERIKNNITKIVFLGFSYSDVDYKYIEKVYAILPSSTQSELWFFTEQDKIKAINYVKKLELSNCEIKQSK